MFSSRKFCLLTVSDKQLYYVVRNLFFPRNFNIIQPRSHGLFPYLGVRREKGKGKGRGKKAMGTRLQYNTDIANIASLVNEAHST